MQVKCSKCGQLIALSDIIESADGRLSHVECARPRTLTADERHLLFVYCGDHIVAQCLSCGLSFRLMELAADPLGGRTNICPRCRKDLTENVRTHLYGCAKLRAPGAAICRNLPPRDPHTYEGAATVSDRPR